MTARTEVAVGGIVVHGGALLLVQRGRGVGAGAWSVPGGRAEPGETLGEAVVRELAEETGLDVRCGAFVGWVERRGADHHYLIFDFLAELVGDGTAVAGDDAAALAWVPLDEVRARRGLVPGLVEFLGGHGVLTP